MKKLLTWKEACELSGLTENQLKKAVQKGDLKAYWRNDKSYGVTEETLERFLESKVVDKRLLKKTAT